MPATDSLKKKRTPAEDAMAGSPAAFDGQGLQMPPEVLALIQSLMMPPVTQGLGRFAQQVPGQVGRLSNAGALFPEGELPQLLNRSMAKEFEDVASPSRVNYVRNQNMANWHAQNQDWPRVLADKWAMLTHQAGS